MKLQHAYQEFMKEIEARKYTPKTIRSYRNNLDLFLRYCADNDVTDTEDVRLGTVKGFMLFMSERKGNIHQLSAENGEVVHPVLLRGRVWLLQYKG